VIREPHGTYHLNYRLIRTGYAEIVRLEAEARRERDPLMRAETAAEALSWAGGELAEGVSASDRGCRTADGFAAQPRSSR
jgi:hypothetical protein